MLTPEIIVIMFTRGLPYVQCTKNRLTCKNYTANYKIFHELQLNSRRFPGVVDTLLILSGTRLHTSAKDFQTTTCKDDSSTSEKQPQFNTKYD